MMFNQPTKLSLEALTTIDPPSIGLLRGGELRELIFKMLVLSEEQGAQLLRQSFINFVLANGSTEARLKLLKILDVILHVINNVNKSTEYKIALIIKILRMLKQENSFICEEDGQRSIFNEVVYTICGQIDGSITMPNSTGINANLGAANGAKLLGVITNHVSLEI